METIKLSINEIKILKHAVGFEIDKVKRGKIKSYRNRYCVKENGEEMKNLIKYKLVFGEPGADFWFYHVTEKVLNI